MDRSTTTYQGDLTDVVLKASGGGGGSSDAALSQSTLGISTWQFSCDDNNTSGSGFDQFSIDGPIFGDPFCNIRDPLFHELSLAATGSSYFSNNFGSADDHMVASSSSACDQVLINSADGKSNCSLFSRIQISPDDPISKLLVNCPSPAVVTPAAVGAATDYCSSRSNRFRGVISGDNQMISVNSPKGCIIGHPGLVQISSPRNLGIKRRKGQAKKVVCIPAPAAANNRPNSEVVPSDLWAWRKYGQKPIKGSPYPRGYYRCSSSKGCSARKQVERSRTDPNMLVVTYTSEHNHPWPTQRNVLAGSTRSPHPSKTNPNSSINHSKTNKTASINKQDHKGDTTSNNVSSTTSTAVKLEHNDHSRDTTGYGSNIAAAVGPEMSALPYHDTRGHDHDQFIITSNTEDLNYRPSAILMADQSISEDFFAELGEIDSDPLDDHLLFNHHHDHQHQAGFGGDHDHKETSNALDPFMSSIIYDWSVNSSNNNNSNSTSSFGEAEETDKD